MKFSKLLPLLIISLSPVFADAKGAIGSVEDNNSGIITPDIATGMRSYTMYTSDVTGAMVVCPERTFSGNCGGWLRLEQVVPRGRTLVGFRIISGVNGARELEVYWK